MQFRFNVPFYEQKIFSLIEKMEYNRRTWAQLYNHHEQGSGNQIPNADKTEQILTRIPLVPLVLFNDHVAFRNS